MTGFLSQAEQTAILAFLLNGGTLTPNTTLYAGLCTGVTQSTGAIAGEPTGNNYSRVELSVDDTSVFGAAASGQIANTAAITFPTSTGAWASGGTLSYWFLSASSSGGTAIFFGLIDNGENPDGVAVTAANQTVSLPAGQLALNASGW